MPPDIRPLTPKDVPHVVELSLRAWAPNFAVLREVLGPTIFDRMHPDWRVDQQRDVEAACNDMTVWVADASGRPVGFVAVVLHPEHDEGHIHMLAVAPDFHDRGIGTTLTEHAVAWIKDAGMGIAVVETGGDAGHAAARHTYEKVGFTPLPAARYFMAL